MVKAIPNKRVTFNVKVDWDRDGNYTTLGSTLLGDDIGRYVKELSIDIGANAPSDVVASIGSCRLMLNNTSKWFSPSYAASPVYGKVLPRIPFIVEATDGGRTWTRFKGFISSITPSSGTRLSRDVEITGVDYLGILQGHHVAMPVVADMRGDQVVKFLINNAIAPAFDSLTVYDTVTPVAGDTITVNGIAYTYRASLSAAGDLLIPSNFRARSEAFEVLKKAINGEGGSGTIYHASTTRPPYARAYMSPSYYQTVLDDRPVRYYRYNEPSGSTAYDHGSNGSNGAYVGSPTLAATGAFGSADADTAVTLNGSTQYMTAPTLDFAGRSWTLVTWIKPASSPPANQDFLSIYSSFTAGGAIYLRLYNTGVVYAEIYSNGSVQSAASAVAFGGSSFYMIAVSYDAITEMLSLYINGVLVDSDVVTAFSGSGPVIEIGAFTSAGGNKHKGVQDDTEFYFDCLSTAQLLAHYQSASTTLGVVVISTLPGSEGALSTSASGLTTVPGVSAPNALTGTLTYDTGILTFDYAGDNWNENTNTLTAIKDVTQSEVGIGLSFFQDCDGLLYWHNRDWQFTRSAATVAARFERESLHVGSSDIERIYNRVVVSYVPRSTVASGVIAKANGVINVPGTGAVKDVGGGNDFGLRRKPTVVSGDVNYKEIDLQYSDPATGKKMAATSLVLPPEPITDWVAGENTDDESNFYNNFTYLDFSVENKGTKAKVTITNRATGTLKIFNLQLRGEGLARYEKTQIVREDQTSIDLYQRRTLSIDLPLPVEPEVAEAFAEYLLQRYKDPAFEVTEFSVGSRVFVDGYNVYDLKIGDVVEISDTQFGTTSVKHMIIGIGLNMSVSGDANLRFKCHRIDDQDYALWDVGTWDTSKWVI